MTALPPFETSTGRRLVNFEAAVMDRLNAAVIVCDLTGRLIYANPYAERMYGRPASELVGAVAENVAGVELDPATALEILGELKAGRSWQGEFDVHRPDGTSVTVRASDSGLYDEAGRLTGVVSMVTDISDHRQSLDRLSRETRALRFLLDATTVLASSLDFRDCLRRLAELAVPILGDLCLIDVAADGTVARMAAAHADPARQALADELASRYPPDPRGAHPAVKAMQSGRAEIASDVTEEFLRATSRDERHLQILKDLGFTSYMCAPLRARGRNLGTITLISAGSGRRFDEDDLALAGELAQRAALVVDNARLLSERTRVAQSLQSALLPPSLPRVPGVELAARYRAAGEANDVGGDFYDVFGVGRGVWVAAVGDVCGTGPEAAAVTGLVRHALHASAQQRRDPGALLDTANAVLRDEHEQDWERFCSAACAVIRPGAAVRVTLASAGHPPVMVLRADGRVEEIEIRGVALGLDARLRLQTRRMVLGAGDILLLYTDGLTEARDGEGHFFGETAFTPLLGELAGLGAEVVVTRLLQAVEEFSAGRLTDDLALLAIRATGSAGTSR
ncbi:MAG TPA: SpoIIE family protein phosphatase [Acidimicrobiales bacterium]|nr:SpoIIE family protein phosphatase [Acidimicrobiales bacterium]